MELNALSGSVSNDALSRVQGQVQVQVLRKAMEIETQTAAQLVQALPQAKPVEAGQPGALVNTYA